MIPASLDATELILPQKLDFPSTAADQFQPVFHQGPIKIIPARIAMRSGAAKARLLSGK
jgi:hypothetical protein